MAAGDAEEEAAPAAGRPNYITTAGLKKLRDEYDQLLNDERPKLCKTIEWAAGNGDRSENADYIYGKKRLREIDRRLRFLGKKIEKALVVDVAKQKRDRIYFGATVTVSDEDGIESTYQIVGEDETDAKAGKISWISPLGKAILGKKVDDEVVVKRPSGDKLITIIGFDYR